MYKLKLSILFLSALAFGCANSSSERNKPELGVPEVNQNGQATEEIQLNNGEKWKVDAEMLSTIRKMESEVSNCAGKEIADYKMLSENLKANIDLLTSNCTMKGQAHDELHKWLLPYIDLVNEFSDAIDSGQSENLFQELQISFVTFNKYFQ